MSIHSEVVAIVGLYVGAFLTGIAVMLGISSILLLFSGRGAHPKQHYFLCIYTIIILLLLVTVEVQGFIIDIREFLFQAYFAGSSLTSIAAGTTLVLLVALTDGLLVWRCFLVQRALSRGSSKWGDLFWIFPACLWGITTVVTSVYSSNFTLHPVIGILGFTSNMILNTYATLFLTIRLLLHRRMVMACAQDKALAARHIYIVGILLESAAVNLPVVIAAVTRLGESYAVDMILIAAAGQVLAAVLIIYQTALGRAFSAQKEAEIRQVGGSEGV